MKANHVANDRPASGFTLTELLVGIGTEGILWGKCPAGFMKTLRSSPRSRALFACALGLWFGTGGAFAATLYVSPESTNPVPPFATWATAATNIQDAVDAARAGDTVLVTNGVYSVGSREMFDSNANSLGVSRVVVTKAITLQSVNGPLVTTIAGARVFDEQGSPTTPTNGMRCVFVGANGTLSGFTLTNGFAASGGGVRGESLSAVVSNCLITGNSASGGGGANGGTLYNCTVTGNSAEGYGGGASWSTLNNCTVAGNSAFWSGGGAYGCTMYNCVLSNNVARLY